MNFTLFVNIILLDYRIFIFHEFLILLLCFKKEDIINMDNIKTSKLITL